MGRPPRIEVPGGFYHVGTRGNDQQTTFFDNGTRRIFLGLLARVCRRHGWRVFAYCLMTNHYHLVLQLDEGGLSQGMCELNGTYAEIANAWQRRQDHLWGKRFWSELLETDAHLLQACRYVVANPVRAGLVEDERQWVWSSHRAILGLVLPPPFLARGELLGLFGTKPERAVRSYAAYVAEGHVRCQAPGIEV